MVRQPVLEVRVSCLDLEPSVTAMCPGFEAGRWRAEELARDVLDRHLVSFALSYSDYSQIDHESAVDSIRRAAKAVYQTEKYGRRGEFGELILHALIRDVFGSEPAISKIYFKDAPNDTVKGFDAVHIVDIDDELELWLGEVKFYERLDLAIRHVTEELADHLKGDYLRGEFVAIGNKLDPSWPHHDTVAALIDANVSLDQIFGVVTVPVLLTYDSKVVGAGTVLSDQYVRQLKEEALAGWEKFRNACDPAWPVRIRLLLLPLKKKKELVELMNGRLTTWQAM